MYVTISFGVVVDDIVAFQRDLVRLGDESAAMRQEGLGMLPAFNETVLAQVNKIYKHKPLKALNAQAWPGVICQPFVFGNGDVDWDGAEGLKGKLHTLLRHQKGTSLYVTRIARIYDGQFLFLLKPDRLRYWLRSIALRDADEMLSDFRAQGF